VLRDAQADRGKGRGFGYHFVQWKCGCVSRAPPWFVWGWRKSGKVGLLLAATRQRMAQHGIQNKVDRGAGVYRTFQIQTSHVAIAQSAPTRCCPRDGIIAEGEL
jgi:hypothetical protein